MKQSKRIQIRQKLAGLAAAALLAVAGNNVASAYELYTDGCNDCHGNFRDATTTKGTVFPSNNNHTMHNGTSYMDTDCALCHIGSSRTPVYLGRSTGTGNNNGLGCAGCHVRAGLLAHHLVNGVSECLDCHDAETSVPENVTPPYYTGSWAALTKVRNPGNTVRASNTNENWSVGDFLGLDNDGNNLYDLADYAIGPKERISSTAREGNNIRVTWQTVGGRTNRLQSAGTPAGTYTNVGPSFTIPGIGVVTTNYLEVGGATNKTRFYRLRTQVP